MLSVHLRRPSIVGRFTIALLCTGMLAQATGTSARAGGSSIFDDDSPATKPAPQVPQPATAPSAEPPAETPATPENQSPGQGNVIDLLKDLDAQAATVLGEWRMEDGVLVSGKSQPAILEFNYAPPAEYDYQIVCSREEGGGLVGLYCTAAGRRFREVTGGSKNTLCGFGDLMGMPSDRNLATERFGLRNGQRYTILVKVRRPDVAVYVNGELITQWRTNYLDLAMPHGHSFRHGDTIGLETRESVYRIYSAQVREIAGTGRMVKPGDPDNIRAIATITYHGWHEANTAQLHVYSNGYLGDPYGDRRWFLRADRIVLTSGDGLDICQLSADRESFEGKNSDGHRVFGEVTEGGFPDATEPASESDVLTGAVPAASEGEPAAHGHVVDLLKNLDVQTACIGQWNSEEGVLTSGKAQHTVIEFNYVPPEEYDYQVVCSREDGNDAIDLYCAAGGRQFRYLVGAWSNHVSGFSDIDGEDADCNQTTGRITLEDHRKYTVVVKVRRNGVAAYLDGNLISHWETNYLDMGISVDKRLRRCDTIGLEAWNSVYRIYAATITEIGGVGRLVKEGDPDSIRTVATIVYHGVHLDYVHHWKLFSTGFFEEPEGACRWFQRGHRIVFAFEGSVDICTVSADGKTFEGTNGSGGRVHGEVISGDLLGPAVASASPPGGSN
jgi:hypothetical protein